MESCHARRGGGDPSKPGAATSARQIQHQHVDDLLIYLVETNTEFTDADGDLVASVDAAFALSYVVGGVAPNARDMEAFEASVVLQVTPFVREFLASTTNRLGMPPFLLPLARNPQIETLG